MSEERDPELLRYIGRLEAECEQLRRRLEHVDLWAARTREAAESVRPLLLSMQESKFWRMRNAWFALKHRLGMHPEGPQPPVDLLIAEYEPNVERGAAYERWLRANDLRSADADVVRRMSEVLPRTPLISVVMPVFDPPERYLRAALDSVAEQLYPHWELCVADDASTNPRVREVLREYAADDRVKLVLRERNGHIAEASNSALALASGEFVALLDHDDVLARDALFHVALVANRHPDAGFIYSDEDKIDDLGRRSEPYFKPEWSPDSLLARMYVGHLAVFRRTLLQEIGGFRSGFEGSQDYDLVLRATERTQRIHHIPRVLYHWRIHPESTAASAGSKEYAYDAGRRALEEALARRGEPGRVDALPEPGSYVVRYAIANPGKVSVIVPTRDHGEDVERCLGSVFARAASYPNFEVLLIDNGSADRGSLETFARWAAQEPRVRVLRYDAPFNFARINNAGAAATGGAYLLFLNNDTEVVSEDWLHAMVEYAQRPSIGAVGAKLLYPDGTVQHAGVVTGIGGVAGHAHKYADANAGGYFNTLRTVNNYSAVTGACLMVRRDAFDRAGGFDERLAVAYNDVDFCLKLRESGLYNVYLAHVVLVHHESKSRGYEEGAEKLARFAAERQLMEARWRCAELGDPHYSPHLSLTTEDFSLRA
jgi:GT2 family glycosyltransferase